MSIEVKRSTQQDGYKTELPLLVVRHQVHRDEIAALARLHLERADEYERNRFLAEVLGEPRGHRSGGYMVFRTDGHGPVAVHSSSTKAAAEADRLAALNPGKTFRILQIIGERSVQQVTHLSRSGWGP